MENILILKIFNIAQSFSNKFELRLQLNYYIMSISDFAIHLIRSKRGVDYILKYMSKL